MFTKKVSTKAAVPAGAIPTAKLPTPEEDVGGVYWGHLHWLVEESRRRTAKARASEVPAP